MPQRHRPELSEAVAGERLVGYRRSARTFAQGRTCQHGGCTTRLSIYNSGKLCALHAAYKAAGIDSLLAEDPAQLAAS